MKQLHLMSRSPSLRACLHATVLGLAIGCTGADSADGPGRAAPGLPATGPLSPASSPPPAVSGLPTPGSELGTAADVVPVVDPGHGGAPPELTDKVTLHLVGDSTAAEFPPTDPTGRVGWGVPLVGYFGAGVSVNNAARSGRSSKSYYNEGHWGEVRSAIAPGDYVLIQFSHNDEKREDPLRFTDPATTFREYLSIYIGQTRQAGGFAILLTPTNRLAFTLSGLEESHGSYPDAIRELAQATGTPVIDMTAKTKTLYEALGPLDSVPLFAADDRTHTSAEGAQLVAGLVVEGLVEHNFPIVERLVATQ